MRKSIRKHLHVSRTRSMSAIASQKQFACGCCRCFFWAGSLRSAERGGAAAAAASSSRPGSMREACWHWHPHCSCVPLPCQRLPQHLSLARQDVIENCVGLNISSTLRSQINTGCSRYTLRFLCRMNKTYAVAVGSTAKCMDS